MHYGRFDLVCFSSVFSEFAFIREVASYVKQHFQAFTLLGGSHVTVSPHTSYLDTSMPCASAKERRPWRNWPGD
jgi:hypothetical protein